MNIGGTEDVLIGCLVVGWVYCWVFRGWLGVLLDI